MSLGRDHYDTARAVVARLSYFRLTPRLSMIATNIWFWVGFIAFVLAMLALDLGVFHRTPHVVQRARKRRSGRPSGSALALALRRRARLLRRPPGRADVPHRLRDRGVAQRRQHLRHRADLRVLRACRRSASTACCSTASSARWSCAACSSALGAALLARFDWILYIFGAMLVVTGVRMAVKQDEEFDGEQNPVVKLVRRVPPAHRRLSRQALLHRRERAPLRDAAAARARARRGHGPHLRGRLDPGDLRRDARSRSSSSRRTSSPCSGCGRSTSCSRPS